MAPKRRINSSKSAANDKPQDAACQSIEDFVPSDNKKSPSDLDSRNKDDDLSTDGCLHCLQVAENSDIQVRCYDCCRYICSQCHWCHEFQANHEIRVCDRCDAFYCRICDEMDQCDDCGEVVCASCSTLLSCKFCGGGLCEECATACGRCGIVLCNRDAKFAVDCDTCRLSYCLVCLASGGKDPCIRCGHRPSKRMEQLVHLRLKSIYKAFKQSSANPTLTTSAFSVTGHHGATASTVEKHILNATRNHASKGKNSVSWKPDYDDGPNFDIEEDYALEGRPLKPASSASAKSDNIVDSTLGQNYPNDEGYKKEQQKADAAAAALLAELDEEEEAARSKKSKKKRKKERQQAKKGQDDDQGVECETDENFESYLLGSELGAKVGNADNKTSISETDSTRSANVTYARDTKCSSESSDALFGYRNKATPSPEEIDPIEKELYVLVEVADVRGLERILTSMKGVPGRAMLRKNAKKALKRIRAEQDAQIKNAPKTSEPQSYGDEIGLPAANDHVVQHVAGPNDLLKVISETHLKQTPGLSSSTRTRPMQAGLASGKCECLLKMSPLIIGWVIGKGGQRIRDLMEESGARVWIDQESVAPTEPRTVYVSGQRKNVDSAVQMIQDLVDKAPINTQLKNTADSTPSLEPDLAAGTANNEATKLTKKLPAEIPVSKDDGNNAEHIITCDARFVPLLIGRRGWTIKHIQDSSHAKVDIDQSVEPRRITISGSRDSVELATSMVQDVLSYPQSQLQGSHQDHGAKDSEAPVALGGTNGVSEVKDTSGGKQILPKENPVSPSSPVAVVSSPDNMKLCSDTPPPSSLIMNAEAESTVSVSSSLSSTPEPSMSSSQVPYAQVFPLPSSVLQPHGNSAALGGRMDERLAPGIPAPDRYIPPGYNSFDSQLPGLHHDPRHFHQPASLLPPSPGPGTPSSQHGRMSYNRLGGMYGMEQKKPASSFVAPPRIPNYQNQQVGLQHEVQCQTAYDYRRDAPGSSGPASHFGGLDPSNSGVNAPLSHSSGPWDRPRLDGPLARQEKPAKDFHLEAAVSFLHGEDQKKSGFAAALNQPHGMLNTPIRDESRMVDSLFATGEIEKESSILNSLQGLSMNGGSGGDNSMMGLFASADERRAGNVPFQSPLFPASSGIHSAQPQSDPFSSQFSWNNRSSGSKSFNS